MKNSGLVHYIICKSKKYVQAGRFSLLILLICFFTLSTSCGKMGDPVPRVKNKSFSLNNVKVEPVEDCLQFNADLSGNYDNFKELRLELSPLNGPQDCPGCPFMAKDVLYFSPKDANFDPDKGIISFSYCPEPASAYRWRLSATNVRDNMTYFGGVDRLVVMPTKGAAKDSSKDSKAAPPSASPAANK